MKKMDITLLILLALPFLCLSMVCEFWDCFVGE